MGQNPGMSDPAELERLQARHDREHMRRCALETFLARLALLVGQDLIDRAWGEMEERHGKQVFLGSPQASWSVERLEPLEQLEPRERAPR